MVRKILVWSGPRRLSQNSVQIQCKLNFIKPGQLSVQLRLSVVEVIFRARPVSGKQKLFGRARFWKSQAEPSPPLKVEIQTRLAIHLFKINNNYSNLQSKPKKLCDIQSFFSPLPKITVQKWQSQSI